MSLSSEDLQGLAAALNKLATAGTSNSTESTTAAASLKLPPFWKHEPTLWFAQIESLFSTKNITQDKTKYDYVISSLDSTTALEIKPTILKPPAENKYDGIKKALIAAYDRTQEAKDAELLSITDIGDRSPTSYLRHLLSLNSSGETLIRALFLSHLPPNVRVIVQAQGHSDIEELAKAAERAVNARDASRQPPSASAVQTKRGPNKRRENNNSKERSGNYICYYHRKFGKNATKCQPDCIFGDKTASKAANQIDAGNDETDCL